MKHGFTAVLVIVLSCLLLPSALRAHEENTGRYLTGDLVPGVVIDTRHNLMWELKTPENKDDLYTWQQAREYAWDLDLAGFHDWRMPTAMELATLVDVGIEPDIENETGCIAEIFPLNGPYHFWTASEFPPIPSVVQYTSFYNGSQFKWDKLGLLRVRCVRGAGWTANYPGTLLDGQAERFVIHEEVPDEVTVYDNVTGLEWEQKADHGESPPGAEIDELIYSLIDAAIQLPAWGEAILLDEFLVTGFFDDQQAGFLPNGLALMGDIPHLLLSFLPQLIDELADLQLEGQSLLGGRSFFMAYTYPEAEDFVEQELNAMEFAGRKDWRLPTVTELNTIVDYNRVPCIFEEFTPTFAWMFWTSTPTHDQERHYAVCAAGSVICAYGPNGSPLHVRAVRGDMNEPVPMLPYLQGVEPPTSRAAQEGAASPENTPVTTAAADDDGGCFLTTITERPAS